MLIRILELIENIMKKINVNNILLIALFITLVFTKILMAGESVTNKVRVGTLQFGTVNWEMDVIQRNQIAEQEGLVLEVVPLASKNAAAVALQGGAVDIIVTDWFWVSRQRTNNKNYTFAPHSIASGGILSHSESGIESLKDLEGQKVGVAGGSVDKSWLLIQAYYKKKYGENLAEKMIPVFGAPPLLNKITEKGELSAVLTYWHYQARLLPLGFNKIFPIKKVFQELNISDQIPIVGWVFDESWAKENPESISKFLKVSAKAKEIMSKSDEEWIKLRKIMKAKDEEIFIALRDGYREGIPKSFTEKEISDARKLFSILANIGGKKLVGKSRKLEYGTFWVNREKE